MASAYQLIIHVDNGGGLSNGMVGHTYVELKSPTGSVFRGKWPANHGINSLYTAESIHDESNRYANSELLGYEHVSSSAIDLTEEEYLQAMNAAYGFNDVGAGLTTENKYIFLSNNCADFAQSILKAAGKDGNILDYFAPDDIGFDSPVETYIQLAWGIEIISDVQEIFSKFTTFVENGVTQVFGGIEHVIEDISNNFGGSINDFFADIFGQEKVADTNTYEVFVGEAIPVALSMGGTINDPDLVTVITTENMSYTYSVIDTSATMTVGSTIYMLNEVMGSVQSAANAVATFVYDKVEAGTSWFTDSNGAQASVASWLASNVSNLLDGNMSVSDALIDLAKHLGQAYLSNFTPSSVTGINSAKSVIKDVVEQFGIVPEEAALYANSIYSALESLAINFAQNGFEWDSQQMLNAGLASLSGAITSTYMTNHNLCNASQYSNGQIGGTVAAVTTAIAGLLNSGDFDSGDWIMLGVQTGIAYAAGYAGAQIGAYLGSFIPIPGLGTIAGAIIGYLSGKLVSSIYWGKVFREGEFGDPSLVIKSIYTVEMIDDGNGGTIEALVAHNTSGSTIVARGIITHLIGNTGGDVLVGQAGIDNYLIGNEGDDYLEGRGGKDALFGGNGNDIMNGGMGDDILQGDNGDDTIFGEEGNDIVIAGNGDDFVHLGSGDDIANGGDGSDYILASMGNDAIAGEAGDDMLDGGEGDDSIDGGDGDDMILGNLGNDSIAGGAGSDVIFGAEGNDTVYGGDGNDFVDGGDGVDILNGENGDDLMSGGGDDDFMDGGLGNDNMVGGSGNDAMLGGMDDDFLDGEDGDDTLDGGFGNDILKGGKGADTLSGGEGDDAYVISSDATDANNIIADTAGNDTILLAWLGASDAAANLTLVKDGDNLIVRHGSRTLATVNGQFTGAAGAIEKIELGSNKYIDLSQVNFNSAGVGTFTIGELASGGVGSAVSSREVQTQQDMLTKELYFNGSFLENLSLLAYDEKLGQEIDNEYYNGTNVTAFFRKRSIFGGKYTVYKLDQPGNITGTDAGVGYFLMDPNPAVQQFAARFNAGTDKLGTSYDDLFLNAQVIYTSPSSTGIMDVIVNGQVVYTRVLGDGTYYAPGATIAGRDIAFRLSHAEQTYHTAVATKHIGEDLLVGAHWGETIDGKTGDDVLVGNGGNDILIGGAGDDWLLSGEGNDNASGDDGNDIIFGNGGNDTLSGGNGEDAMLGGEGADVLKGDAGNDWLDGGSGNDTLEGGADNDILRGGTGEDTLDGGAGNDIIHGDDGDDNLTGGDGDDLLFGGAGQDSLVGGAGNDILDGGGGVSNFNGGDGFDRISFRSSTVGLTLYMEQVFNGANGDTFISVEGLEGTNYNDIIYGYENQSSYIMGAAGDDIIYGGNANDTIDGGAGNNEIYAGGGDDVIFAGVDREKFNGGAGSDTVTYEYSHDVIYVDLSQGVGNHGYANNDNYISIENIVGSHHNDEIYGDANANMLHGMAGDDYLEGRAGDDLIYGGMGNDIVKGGTGNDTLHGNEGNDLLYGEDGDDTIFGGSGDDHLYAGAGSNMLYGDAGQDVFHDGSGNNTFDGGDGFDRITFRDSTTALNLNMTQIFTANGDIFISVEGLEGTDYSDIIYGFANQSSYLMGAGGDDTIYGGDANDTIDGGSGNNVIHAGGGNDVMFAGPDGEWFDGGSGSDTVTYEYGVQGIYADLDRNVGNSNYATGDTYTSIENIVGSMSNDDIYGDGNANMLHGMAGDDYIESRAGDDLVYGGDGNDTLKTGLGSDTVYGGNGNDIIQGANGNDIIYGEAGNDNILGEEDNDIIEGGAGADKLNGGSGIDTVSYATSASRVVVNFSTNSYSEGDATGDEVSNFENITGSNHNDILTGDAGVNVITGGNGEDVLDGRAGADTLDGGNGVDRASYEYSNAAVTIDLNSSGPQSGGHAAGDILISIQNLTGSAYNDTIIASADQNAINGGAGIDTVSYIASTAGVFVDLNSVGEQSQGYAAGDALTNIENLVGSNFNDTLFSNSSSQRIDGGAGDDNIVANTGARTYIGGTGTDQINYRYSTGAVTLNFATGVFGGAAAGHILLGFENFMGSGFDDTIIGDAGDNRIIGLGGADTLDGGAGIDTLGYHTSDAGVVVNLLTGTASGGHATGDVISNFENLSGSSHNDVLTGNAGANIITGGVGDDILDGGAGADTLDGGEGIDRASYESSNAGVTIDLNASGPQTGGHAEGDILISIQNLTGSAYNDTFIASAEQNAIDGGAGIDTVSYANSDAAVFIDLNNTGEHTQGYAAGDVLANIEILIGSNFNDTLFSNSSSQRIDGGAGDDNIVANTGARSYIGGTGTDQINYRYSTGAVTLNFATGVFGGAAAGHILSGFENFMGSGFNDAIIGDAGNNRIIGLGGADTLDGGAGIDTLGYHTSDAGVNVNLATGAASGGHATGDIISNFENLSGSSYNDVLTGNAGANILNGSDGDDMLDGGAGGDTLDGGEGIDTASYASSNTAVTVDLGNTGAQSGGHAQGDILIGIENLIGSNYNDTLTGNSADQTIDGGAGNDNIVASGGTDSYIGGAGTDQINYRYATSAVTLNFATGVFGGYAATHTLLGFENYMGSNYNDTIIGDASNNQIIGLGGADTLDGGAGTDTLGYQTSTAGVNVNLQTGAASGGHAAGDVFTNFENITGSSYNDVLTGNTGANVLLGGDGNDTLQGGDGNDTLDGGNGNNNLQGGGGNDLIYSGTGGDTINGGAGTDTLSYLKSTTWINVDLGASYAMNGFATGDTIINIENLTGSNYDDFLAGNAGNNVIDGGAGNDWLSGGDGNDTLIGGAGSNSLLGGNGDDLLHSGTGNDTLDGGAGIDTVSYIYANSWVNIDLSTHYAYNGYANGDVITNVENLTGSNYADFLAGDAGNNVIDGGAGDDWLSGGAGNDTLIGGTGNNALLGGDGDDLLISGTGVDTVTGGNGIDTVSYAASNAAVTIRLASSAVQAGGYAAGDVITGVENVIGSNYNDTLMGTAGANVITGGAGDDIIDGGNGGDTMDGGAGIDTLSYASSKAAVNINLATRVVSGGFAAGDIISNFENLTGSAYDDVLTGSLLANIIRGGNGNDTIDGGNGGDTLDGGAGIDTLSYGTSNAGVSVNLATRAVSGGFATGDIITNFENVSGSSYNDVLTGNSAANVIKGGNGNDIIDGGNGGDTLDGGAGIDTLSYATSNAGVTVNLAAKTASGGYATDDIISNFENLTGSKYNDTLAGTSGANTIQGGAGNDTIQGGAGADILDGGAGSDMVSYAGSNAAVIVNLSLATAQSGGHAAGDLLSGFESLTGSNYHDTLTGTSGANTIQGGAGNDTIEGGAGADILDGGAGSDMVSYASSNAAVNVDLMRSTAQAGGHAAGDILSNFESITGSGFNDTLIGNAGANTLIGGAGNDSITGGAGADRLTGGSGADKFKYSATTDSGKTATTRDIIADFNHAEGDRIDLSLFTGTFAFKGTGALDGTGPQVNYTQANGNTIIGIDTNGDHIVDFQIELTGLHVLEQSDFVL